MTDLVEIIELDDAPIEELGLEEVSEVLSTEDTGQQGPPGDDAKVAFGFMAPGPYSPLEYIMHLVMDGAGTLTAADSSSLPGVGFTAETTRYVTKNGTFADPRFATALEIAASLFATITYPATYPGTDFAEWDYPTGGAFVPKDVLHVWESLSPDLTGANVAYTFAGA